MPNSKYFQAASGMQKLFLLRKLCIRRATADLDIHFGQLPVLEYVDHHDGCTQSEVAEQMLVTPASIALSTKRLQKAGLLRKSTDETNLRRNCLSITDKGRELALKCRRIHDAFDESLFQGFSDADMDAFLAYLERMIGNITGEEDGLENGCLTLGGLDARLRAKWKSREDTV